MTSPNPNTGSLLTGHLAGDAEATSRLTELIYTELRELAARYMRRERPDHTLQATALANEAYLRLTDGVELEASSRSEFMAIAASTLRRVLIDHARRRDARKRGDGGLQVTWVEPGVAGANALDLLALHEALEQLALRSTRQAELVELRFFGGLTIDEAASVLGISRDTAKADWRLARAWLNLELTRGRTE